MYLRGCAGGWLVSCVMPILEGVRGREDSHFLHLFDEGVLDVCGHEDVLRRETDLQAPHRAARLHNQ